MVIKHSSATSSYSSPSSSNVFTISFRDQRKIVFRTFSSFSFSHNSIAPIHCQCFGLSGGSFDRKLFLIFSFVVDLWMHQKTSSFWLARARSSWKKWPTTTPQEEEAHHHQWCDCGWLRPNNVNPNSNHSAGHEWTKERTYGRPSLYSFAGWCCWCSWVPLTFMTFRLMMMMSPQIRFTLSALSVVWGWAVSHQQYLLPLAHHPSIHPPDPSHPQQHQIVGDVELPNWVITELFCRWHSWPGGRG